MPPQSRGEGSTARTFSGTLNVPPTLGSFLENLPSPSSTISDQRTPTGPLPNGTRHSPPTSPTRNSSHLSGSQLDPDEDDDEDDSVTLDDADFQSHYSRQSSPASTSSEDLSDTEDGIPHTTSPFSSPIHHTTSSQSLPPLPLYPPFYNRPPTPLPPSPSLTSLLRPPSLLNRSTTSTRPTTPDSSDAETPNDTEAAVAQSARRATVVERVAPKVPTYEYYGFVLYLASSLAFRKSLIQRHQNID
jgi:phosphatidylinositol glycan class P protein